MIRQETVEAIERLIRETAKNQSKQAKEIKTQHYSEPAHLKVEGQQAFLQQKLPGRMLDPVVYGGETA